MLIEEQRAKGHGRASWCGGVAVPRPTCQCSRVSISHAPQRPDPAIYSQQDVLNAGGNPTWNSPDIASVSTPLPGTLDEYALIIVHNLSKDTSAINVAAHVSISELGIGMVRDPLLTVMLSIAPNSQAEFHTPISKKYLDLHQAGIHVSLRHPKDSNLQNNEGSQSFGWGKFASNGLGTAACRVRNPTAQVASFTLICAPSNQLSAKVTPSTLSLAPGAEQQVRLDVERLPGAVPSPLVLGIDVSIYAVDQNGNLIDGVTFRWI